MKKLTLFIAKVDLDKFNKIVNTYQISDVSFVDSGVYVTIYTDKEETETDIFSQVDEIDKKRKK